MTEVALLNLLFATFIVFYYQPGNQFLLLPRNEAPGATLGPRETARFIPSYVVSRQML